MTRCSSEAMVEACRAAAASAMGDASGDNEAIERERGALGNEQGWMERQRRSKGNAVQCQTPNRSLQVPSVTNFRQRDKVTICWAMVVFVGDGG
jgi:hypothetical protein